MAKSRHRIPDYKLKIRDDGLSHFKQVAEALWQCEFTNGFGDWIVTVNFKDMVALLQEKKPFGRGELRTFCVYMHDRLTIPKLEVVGVWAEKLKKLTEEYSSWLARDIAKG